MPALYVLPDLKYPLGGKEIGRIPSAGSRWGCALPLERKGAASRSAEKGSCRKERLAWRREAGSCRGRSAAAKPSVTTGRITSVLPPCGPAGTVYGNPVKTERHPPSGSSHWYTPSRRQVGSAAPTRTGRRHGLQAQRGGARPPGMFPDGKLA